MEVKKYAHVYKFSPGEEVYLSRSGTQEGPYVIYSREDRKYKLCDKNGNIVKNGEAYSERELIPAD